MSTSSTADNTISSQWLLPVRAAWAAVVILLLVLYAAGLPESYRELSTVCTSPPCRIFTITTGELDILRDVGLSLSAYIYYYFTIEFFLLILFVPLAFLIFWRKSDTWLGIVVSLALIFAGVVFFTEETRALGRGAPEYSSLVGFLNSFSVGLVLMLFYLFPDGRFTPRWMRWFAAALFVAILLEPLLNPGGLQASSGSMFVILAFAVGAPMGMISQVYRYRKVSTPSQRQQTKWVLYGFMGMFAGMAPWMILVEIIQIASGPGRLWFYLGLIPQYILIGLFPVSIFIAIMRYRLWDVDLVIRRTMQYALLTGLLALAYYGGVVVLQGILRPLTESGDSALVTVITTLGIAALFNPLRIRVQDFIDRRFYRKKYNAELALAQFAATARDEVDMDRLTAALLFVVEETMHPETVNLWLTQTMRHS